MPNDDRDILYILLGDDAFGLRTYLLKPFSHIGLSEEERIAHYRISRGRRVVENGFGILAQRWQLLLTTMMQGLETVRLIIETCVCLHNRSYVDMLMTANEKVDNMKVGLSRSCGYPCTLFARVWTRLLTLYLSYQLHGPSVYLCPHYYTKRLAWELNRNIILCPDGPQTYRPSLYL
jgi:hypothetical protein